MAYALALAAVFVVAMYAASSSFSPPRGEKVTEGRMRGRFDFQPFFTRLFTGIAAIALFLAIVFALRATLLPYAGLIIGAILLAAAFLIPQKITANALAGAGIAILFASLYVLPARLWITLPAMILVAAIATWIAVRRDSLFIAILGLLGAFAVPALLRFNDQAYPLFGYLLALNLGIAWIAARRNWPVLQAIALPLTVVYEWAYVIQHMEVAELPAVAALIALLAIVGTLPLWLPPRDVAPLPAARGEGGRRPGEGRRFIRYVACAAALLPMLFAFYIASEPNFAKSYNVVFAFLLVIATLVAILATRRELPWLYIAGGVATVVAFLLYFGSWLRQLERGDLFPPQPVPGLVLWLSIWIAAFVILYLIRPSIFAGILFLAFLGLVTRQPSDWRILLTVMLILLGIVAVVALMRNRPSIAATAVIFAALAMMGFLPLMPFYGVFPSHALGAPPPATLLVVVNLILLATFLFFAWAARRPMLSLLAVALFAGMIVTATPSLWIAILPYLAFVAYAFLARESLIPVLTLLLASVLLLLSAWSWITALAIAAIFFALLWWTRNVEPREPRLTLILSAALAFFNAAVPMLLPNGCVLMTWAIEAAVLAWLFTRIPWATLIVWSAGLGAVVIAWLTIDSNLYPSDVANVFRWIVFAVCGLAMYAAAWFVRAHRGLALYFSLLGLTEHWYLVNVLVSDWYKSTGGALNTDFLFASPAQDVTYTIAWVAVATVLLFIGLRFNWQGARVGATSLLLLAVAKAFIHDVPRRGDDYRVASLLGVAIALMLVGLMLQKFRPREA